MVLRSHNDLIISRASSGPPRLASFVVNNSVESYVVIEIRFNSFCAYLQQPDLKLDVDVDECSSNVSSLSKSVHRLSIYTLISVICQSIRSKVHCTNKT